MKGSLNDLVGQRSRTQQTKKYFIFSSVFISAFVFNYLRACSLAAARCPVWFLARKSVNSWYGALVNTDSFHMSGVKYEYVLEIAAKVALAKKHKSNKYLVDYTCFLMLISIIVYRQINAVSF